MGLSKEIKDTYLKFKSEGIIPVVQSSPDYLVSKFPKHPYIFYMLISVRHKL